MNSWKLNGQAVHQFRQVLIRDLKIHNEDLYWTVRSISTNGIIETKDGKKYRLKLEEIK